MTSTIKCPVCDWENEPDVQSCECCGWTLAERIVLSPDVESIAEDYTKILNEARAIWDITRIQLSDGKFGYHGIGDLKKALSLKRFTPGHQLDDLIPPVVFIFSSHEADIYVNCKHAGRCLCENPIEVTQLPSGEFRVKRTVFSEGPPRITLWLQPGKYDLGAKYGINSMYVRMNLVPMKPRLLHFDFHKNGCSVLV